MTIQQVPTPPGEITGQVLFYSRPEPLSPEAHGKLGFKSVDAPFAFAASAHILPLQVSEFGPAALNYPIIFAGEFKTPMAILGIRPGENLFVSAQGQYEESAYIPSFIRRYPFVLAGGEGSEQLIVCIDREAPMLVEGGDVPLFVDGKLSTFSQNAVDFCSNFETERRRTDEFVARLKGLDLFEAKAATFTPRSADGIQGQPVQIADYFAISEERLNALPDKDLRDLHVTGALRQISAHAISMFNWERLINRAAARVAVAGHA
ncbi:SapC family protein [Caulobacter sp. S45]|uniref:SapC family protein n=1 Tax=Caulobacter sp. S45 TaxID=1641861 RepID=UPI0015759D75|nr:SapC family protein [Caulobacter sp. S45]